MSQLTSSILTATDIDRFIESAIEGAVGGDVNSDSQSNTGHYENMVTTSQDGGRSAGAWTAYAQYDPTYICLKQMDYFKSLPSLPTGFSESRWLDYITAADILYMGDYVVENGFMTNGYYRYSEGLRELYLRKQADPGLAVPTITQQYMQNIRDLPAYSRMSEYKNPSQYPFGGYTREVAYALQAHVDAEKCGVARANDRLDILVEAAKRKLVDKQNQSTNWTGTYTTLDDSTLINYDEPQDVQKPFMMGLLMKALCDFYDWEVTNGRGADSRVSDIPTLIQNYLDWLINTAVVVSGDDADTASLGQLLWVVDGLTNTTYGKTLTGFRYIDRNQGGESSENLWFDLNALVMYPCFWLAKHLKASDSATAQTFLDYGETMFVGAMYSSGARYMGDFFGGKQYNQQMRWSFDSLELRSEALAATPDYLDAPTLTVDAFPTNATISAGNNRKFYFIPLMTAAVTAAPLTSVTYGGQSMTLLRTCKAVGSGTALQIWVLNAAGIAAAVGTTISTAGGSYTNQSAIHFSLQDCHQAPDHAVSEVRGPKDSGRVLLGRSDNSFTFFLSLSQTSTNIPVLTNPAESNSFTFTDGSVAYGSQTDSESNTYASWTTSSAEDNAAVAINVRPAPSAFALVEVPTNNRANEMRSVKVEGSPTGLTAGNFDVRLENGTGVQAAISNIADNGGGDYTINYVFPQSTAKRFDSTGYALWVSDGTNNATSAVLPYLPHSDYDFVGVVNPNAASEPVLQYGDGTIVTGDQWVYETPTHPSRKALVLDPALNASGLGTLTKDETSRGYRIDAAGVAYANQYIDYLDGTASSTSILANWYLRDADTAGQEPSKLKEETNTNNDLFTVYGTGGMAWGSTPTGRHLSFDGVAGRAYTGYNASRPIFAAIDNNTTFTVEVVCKPETTVDSEGSVFHVGSSVNVGELTISPIGAGSTFQVGWRRDSGGSARILNYAPLTPGNLYHIALIIDTTQVADSDRIQLYVNGVKQAPTSGAYPAQNDVLTTAVAGTGIAIGGRGPTGTGANYIGYVYRVQITDCALTPTQVKASATRMLVDSDRSNSQPVSVAVNDLTTDDSSPTITGTSNLDYGYCAFKIIDASGSEDNYNAIVRGGVFERSTFPLSVPNNVVVPLNPPTEIYTFSANPIRLSNGEVMMMYPHAAGHAGLGQPSTFYGKKSVNDKIYGTEFPIFSYSQYTTSGTSGIIDASGNLRLIFSETDDGAVTGADRRWPYEIINGNPTATSFTNTGITYCDQSFKESRNQRYENGNPLAIPWSYPALFNGKYIQLVYGRNQTWAVEYDEAKGQWSNKQLILDIDDGLGYTITGEPVMTKIDETKCIITWRTTVYNKQFSVRATVDANNKITLIDDITDLESQIEFTDTMLAGCTLRSLTIGEDVLTAIGARNPVYEIQCRRYNKYDVWRNRRLLCGKELDFLKIASYNGTITTSGSNSDFGMPEMLQAYEDGIPTRNSLLWWYDHNNVLISGDPDQHHETEGYNGIFPEWEA